MKSADRTVCLEFLEIDTGVYDAKMRVNENNCESMSTNSWIYICGECEYEDEVDENIRPFLPSWKIWYETVLRNVSQQFFMLYVSFI